MSDSKRYIGIYLYSVLVFTDIEIDFDNKYQIELRNDGGSTAYEVSVQISSERRKFFEIKYDKPLHKKESIIVDIQDMFKGEFQVSVRVRYKDFFGKKYCRCMLYVKDPVNKGYFHLNSYARHCSRLRQILCGGKPPVGKNVKSGWWSVNQ